MGKKILVPCLDVIVIAFFYIRYYFIAARHESYKNLLSAELSNSGRNQTLFGHLTISQDATI